jgi:NAD(P)-dependent dehydrogenase (short-subunit alcohol dehydrogenase family)
MEKLEGKIAVVTGGNSSIGFTVGQLLVADGAYIFITDRWQSEFDAAVEIIGKKCHWSSGDISNLANLDRVNATVKKQKGVFNLHSA